MGKGAIPKYNQKYHPDWAWSLYSRGAIDAEVAEAFGVSVRTIHRWKKDYPEFAEAATQSKDIADAQVEKSLFKLATGFRYTTTDTKITMDSNGNQKPAEIRKTEHEVPPDTGAICFWLKNRRPDEWRDKQIMEFYEVEDLEDIDSEIYTENESGQSTET